MRLAWFSPMPPVRSGIAACSADLVGALRADGAIEIDVFVDEPVARVAPGTRSAHDFVWRHRQRAYDLPVYQLGNSSHHDFLWPYLFRYPGLAVLHDTHLHHARAAALLRTKRVDEYRAEFVANHPDAPPEVAELAIRGFDSHLYYSWPMIRLVAATSRMIAVHSRPAAEALRAELPDAAVEWIRLGHGTDVTAARAGEARTRVLAAHRVPPTAVVFGVFGGLTPEKRIPQVLDAFAALLPYAPDAWLLMGGAPPEHYDPTADVRARGLGSRVVITGYLPSDDELTDHIAACDATLNLRWPTAGETSGPWLRCLAAGKPTVTLDLLQTADVPSLDPRTWTLRILGAPGLESESPDPITIAIDLVDEDHSLRLAMRRLALDAGLRRSVGAAARAWWQRNHTIVAMAADYRRVLPLAIAAVPAVTRGRASLPRHLRDQAEGTLDAVLARFGVASAWSRL
jgi:glycosyltransferase involved in cell wall biosynthesis